MWLWVDRDTIAVLRKIVRKAENDALERAAVACELSSMMAKHPDAIRALKHPD